MFVSSHTCKEDHLFYRIVGPCISLIDAVIQSSIPDLLFHKSLIKTSVFLLVGSYVSDDYGS